MARGSTYKRGDTWYIRYDIEPDPKTGKRRQRSGERGGYASEAEADRALAVALASVITGRHLDDNRQTLAEYARYWLDVVKPGTVRPSTLAHYRRQIEQHIVPELGGVRLQAIRASHINQAKRAWERKGLAATTAGHVFMRLHQILACAVGEQILASNPAGAKLRPRGESAARRLWTPAQMAQFLDIAVLDADYPLWRLYVMSGMRRNEALGLRWRDVDWARERIAVEQQVTYEHRVLDFGPPKSGRGRRVIDLDGETMAVLREHRVRQNAWRLAHPAWQNKDLVYPETDGRPFIPGTINSRWKALLRRHCPELPAITLHGVRHSHASALMAEDGNVRMIADRMGHDPAMLLRVYAHTPDTAQRRGVERLLAAFRVPADATAVASSGVPCATPRATERSGD